MKTCKFTIWAVVPLLYVMVPFRDVRGERGEYLVCAHKMVKAMHANMPQDLVPAVMISVSPEKMRELRHQPSS